MTDLTAEDPISELEIRKSWRTLLGDFVALATGETAARLIGLVAVILMTRRLGPDGFGVITFALAVIGWFAMVQDAGTELLNVRDVSRQPERFRGIAERVLGLRLAMSVLAMAGFALVVSIVSKAQSHRDTLLAFTLVLPALALNLRMMVLGVRGAKAVALGNAISRLVLVIGVVLVVTDRDHVSRVPFLQLAAELAYALVIFAAVSRRFGWARPRVDLASWRVTLKESYPLMANAFARAIVLSFDVFLIGIVLLPRDVGVYGAAAKPSLFVMGAVGLFSISFLSACSAAREDVIAVLLRRSIRTALAISLPIAVVLTAASGQIVPLLFGDKYVRGVAVLAILSWRIPVAALAAPFSTLLISANHQLVMMKNTFAVAGFVLAADGVAVPLFGINGAAVVAVAAGVLGLALSYRSAAVRNLTPSLASLLGRLPAAVERGVSA